MYKVGDRVWDILLQREDTVIGVNIRMDVQQTIITYKLEHHTSWVGASGLQKEQGCTCPLKHNDGRPFDGVSYHCPKHGR